VSAVASEWRTPTGTRFESYLESDIPLHPGFSGGLLLAADGKALGVNTAGVLRGTSLAVPVAVVRRVVDALVAHGRIRRGYLGIGTQTVALPEELRASGGQAAGLIVLSVQAGSPAARAGLRLGDVLLRAGDDVLTHPGALVPALDAERVGRELSLRLLRAGEELGLTVTIGEREAA
jgi:S1-C subfamily serine protease